MGFTFGAPLECLFRNRRPHRFVILEVQFLEYDLNMTLITLVHPPGGDCSDYSAEDLGLSDNSGLATVARMTVFISKTLSHSFCSHQTFSREQTVA